MRREPKELRHDAALIRRAAPASGQGGIGGRAEDAVADYLVARGFVIVARNLRLGNLELDIVARMTGLVVVVEVRTRGRASYEGALASVSMTKRMRLLRAVERLWRERLCRDPGVERIRIDVAGVAFDGGATRVEYVEGAIVSE